MRIIKPVDLTRASDFPAVISCPDLYGTFLGKTINKNSYAVQFALRSTAKKALQRVRPAGF